MSTPRRSSRRAPGSDHGYDVIDHGELNPELGGAGGVQPAGGRSCGARTWGCCWTSSPTTCASPGTPTGAGWTCWRTAPARPTPASSTSTGGRPSPSWSGRVLLPVLPKQYGQALEQDLRAVFEEGRFGIRYNGLRLPLDPRHLDPPAGTGAGRTCAAASATRSPACWSWRASCGPCATCPPAPTPNRPGCASACTSGRSSAAAWTALMESSEEVRQATEESLREHQRPAGRSRAASTGWRRCWPTRPTA